MYRLSLGRTNMSQYGRIGKRRSGSATWQWMLLGFFPGILCGGVLIFAMFASGALNSLTAASLPSATAFIIKEVQIVTATASITPDVSATPESRRLTSIRSPRHRALCSDRLGRSVEPGLTGLSCVQAQGLTITQRPDRASGRPGTGAAGCNAAPRRI